MTETLDRHVTEVTNEVRALPPVGGWAQYEYTGNTSMTCSCGVQVSGPTTQVAPLIHHHTQAAVHGAPSLP